MTGVGNIYSDEILFQARIDPAARIDKLVPRYLKRLFLETRRLGQQLPTARDQAVHRANAQGFIFARTQEGRALLPLRIAAKNLQGPHRLLLSRLPGLPRSSRPPLPLTPCRNFSFHPPI